MMSIKLLDNMEYSSDATAQSAYVTDGGFVSNAGIYDEDMADITDWTDADTGTGVSSQATFDGKSCMKLDGGTSVGVAQRNLDAGTFSTRTVVSFNLYCDLIGTMGSADYFYARFCDGTHALSIIFATDGLKVYDSVAGWQEIGTDLVVQDAWQEWTFDITWGDAPTVDVYLNQVLQSAGVSCHLNSAAASGTTNFQQNRRTVDNPITYVDWFKAGSTWAGGFQSYSESTIKTQGSYALKAVAAQTDSLNKTLTKTF